MTFTTALPALIGSDKQISWATDVRAKAHAAFLAQFAKAPTPKTDKDMAFIAAINAMFAQTDAGWWIDHRQHGEYLRNWSLEAIKLSK